MGWGLTLRSVEERVGIRGWFVAKFVEFAFGHGRDGD
jgi:hypothetical protein